MQTIIIFSGTAVIKGYWRGIHTALQVIFKSVIPFDSKIFFFGYIAQEWLKRDKYVMKILLVAVKKVLPKCMDGYHKGNL